MSGRESDEETTALPLLLASSIHDMKNSLALLMEAIGTAAEAGDPADAGQRDRFATMQGAAARINNDLLHLLTLYRLDQGELRLRIEEVWVREFLEEQLAQQALLLDMRGIEATIDCADDLVGYFDRSLVGGILNNGLVNAARHARQRLELGATAHAGGVRLTITDDGDGFPAAWLDQRRIDQPVNFATGSTSLGIQFARKVAGLHRRGDHRGAVELGNATTGGGEFAVMLP